MKPLIETLFILVPFAAICFAVCIGSFIIGAAAVISLVSILLLMRNEKNTAI